MLERLDVEGDSFALNSGDHLARYLYAAQYVRGRRVADIGCGGGYGAALLKAHGAAEVVAVDIDSGAIEKARRSFGDYGVDYRVDDSQSLSFGREAFDVVCSFENIEHLEQPSRFVSEAARVLRQGGVLMCATPDRAGTPPFKSGKPANPFHHFEWYETEFRELLSRSFKEVEMLAQVQTYSARCRLDAARVVRSKLRGSCGAVLKSLLFRMMGRKYASELGLGVAPPTDYPIVAREIGRLLGYPFCHLALCRIPMVTRE